MNKNKSTLSIRKKLLLYFGLLVFCICIGLGLTSYLVSSRILIKNVNSTLPDAAKEAAQIIESKLEGDLTALKQIENIEKIENPKAKWEEKRILLKEKAKDLGMLSMTISDTKGNSISTKNIKFNISDRDYFKKCLQGKDVISDPMISKADKSLVITFSVPIKDNSGKITGVLSGLKDALKLSDVVKNIKYGKNSEAYILGKDGVTIANVNKDPVLKRENILDMAKTDSSLKTLATLCKKMVNGETGFGKYDFNGEKKYLGFAPIKTTGWSISIAASKNVLLSGVTKILKFMISISLIFLGIGIFFSYIIGKSISDPISRAIKHLKLIASGDYTKEVPENYLKLNDEVGDLAKAIHSMQKDIKDTFYSIRENIEKVNSHSENLSAVSKEMSSSSENVSTTIQDVASATGTQAEDLTTITGSLNNFEKSLNHMITSIEDVTTTSNGIQNTANSSNEKMTNLVSSISKVTVNFDVFIKNLNQLGQNIGKINNITELINSIAAQTNLLALNAAIESARVGDAGKGFAVVADEIRVLAEQSKTSSEEINTLIGTISVENNMIIESSKVVNKVLEESSETLEIGVNSFKSILNGIENIIPKIQSVNSSASLINKEKNSIIEIIESASSVAEEISASAEEVAASSEEMTASTEEVSNAAVELNYMTMDVKKALDKFKLEETENEKET